MTKQQLETFAPVIAIGASGSAGLRDLVAFLSMLDADLPAIVVATLHRPVDQPSLLHAVLQRQSALPIEVVEPGAGRLRAGTCYIGEPANHLCIGPGQTAVLLPDADGAYRNRTIDVLFHSVADHSGPHGVGVVLSGSLADGSRGLLAIKQAGGRVLACHPCRADAGDMPWNAARHAGPLHRVAHVRALADDVQSHVAALMQGSEGIAAA